MQSLWCQWRYRGIDPVRYLTGADPEDGWEDGREAVLTAFAEYSGQVDSAALNMGSALGGVI